nr:hypothetical protein GCM10020092_106710 [Actinoplanes digitatis]
MRVDSAPSSRRSGRRRLGLLLTAILAGALGAVGLSPGAAHAVSGWRSVAASESVSCGVKNAGTLWCWGYNGFGTLGQGDSLDRSTPTQVGLDRDWASITIGYYFACGVKTTGIALCWGLPDYGQLGVGHRSESTHESPERVADDHLWTQLSAGLTHTCGIDVTRALWCWGDNGRGELGVSGTWLTLEPVRVGMANIWTSVVAANQSTCATQRGGRRYCWGANSVGQLGLDDEVDRAVPTLRVGTADPAVGLLA